MKTIYKKDTKGNTRVWRMEIDGARYRTIAGIEGGNLVTSEWTRAQPTNVGRANARTAEQQAAFEVEAQYAKKLAREYHESKDTISDGAHFFKPMLAKKYEKFQPGYVQPKLDGVRCIVNKNGMWSREGKPINGAPHIFRALSEIFRQDPDLILDGELYNHDLHEDFNSIVSCVKKQTPTATDLAKSAELIQYWIYDQPSSIGNFGSRYESLWRLFGLEFSKQTKLTTQKAAACLVLVPTVYLTNEADYNRIHGGFLEGGFEGSIFRLDAPYESKRSSNLLKRKEFTDEEFKLVRIEEGLGNWSGMAKRAVCQLSDGREFGAGIKATQEQARKLLHEKHRIVTVKYFNWTPDGMPRFPVAIKFHGDRREL